MSLSINFRFHGRKRADIFRANRYIRKMGLNPRSVGESKMMDSIKGETFFWKRRVMGKLHRLRDRISRR